ncbi:MAG: nuclease domain-containing protein, partial [Chloroflexota bacterium]
LGSLDRHTRVPDIAIEITQPGYPAHVLILDAKYRLDASGRSVPQDALDDAYAYLGAIGRNDKRSTSGALLLYPGTGKPELYTSGVGAIPLVPGQVDSLVSVLKEMLGNFEV